MRPPCAVFREAVEAILPLVSPMVPHIAEELWQALGHTTTRLQTCRWPQAQAEALAVSALTVVVQVNGKVRSRLEVPAIGHGRGDQRPGPWPTPPLRNGCRASRPKRSVLARRKLVNIVV